MTSTNQDAMTVVSIASRDAVHVEITAQDVALVQVAAEPT